MKSEEVKLEVEVKLLKSEEVKLEVKVKILPFKEVEVKLKWVLWSKIVKKQTTKNSISAVLRCFSSGMNFRKCSLEYFVY